MTGTVNLNLWSEARAEMIGEKLGIDAADVRKRYEQHVRDEQKGAAQGSGGRAGLSCLSGQAAAGW